MILVLAGLELTSNDIHSRISKLSHPVFRPGISVTVNTASSDSYTNSQRRRTGTGFVVTSPTGRRTSYAAYPLEQMRFATNSRSIGTTTMESDYDERLTDTFKSDKSDYRSSRRFGHECEESERSVQSTNGSDGEFPKPPSSKPEV